MTTSCNSQFLHCCCCRYAINTQDSAAGVPGVLYGRYQGDTYAGGNPWVLSTAALASVFYRAATQVLQEGAPSSQALSVWQAAINSPNALPTSSVALAQVFAAQGDGVMLRLRKHVEADGFHLDEQIDRNTGEQMSAEDLTWSVSTGPTSLLNFTYSHCLCTGLY